MNELRRATELPVRQPRPDGRSWHHVARLPDHNPYPSFLVFAFTRDKRFRVELYIDTGDAESNKHIFDALRDFVQEMADKSRPVLEELARTKKLRGKKLKHPGFIAYRELARIVGPQVGLAGLDPHETRLRNALGRLSEETYDEGMVLLSVLVVNAESMRPGHGFFWLAREHLGAYSLDTYDDEIFIQETKRVYDHYHKRLSG